MSLINKINIILEDLQSELDEKAERIAELENMNDDLETKNEDLEHRIAELEDIS